MLKRIGAKIKVYGELVRAGTETNLYRMKHFSITGIVLLTVFIISGCFIFNWKPTWEYLCLHGILIIFAVFSLLAARLGFRSFYIVQSMCIIMYLALFANIILINAYCNSNYCRILIPLFIMLMPTVFEVRQTVTLIISLGMTVVYIISINPERQDVFSCIAAIIFSRLLSYYIFNGKIKEHHVKKELYKLSTVDSLTTLYNKYACEHKCRDYINSSGRKQSYAAMMMDLDNFKTINDMLGHKFGDETLKTFGNQIKELFRKDDIVCRVGGDEFFVLMKNIPSTEYVCQKADGILKICLSHKNDAGIQLGCSIGIVTVNDDKLAYEQLYKLADKLLYKSKRDGKNKYTLVEYKSDIKNRL